MNRLRLPLLAALSLACAHTAPEPTPPPEERPTAAAAQKAPAPAAAAPAAPAPAAKAPAAGAQAARPAGEKAPSTSSTASTSGASKAPAGGAKAAAPAAAAGSKGEAGGAVDYFPLAVGNEWVYVDQSPALPENRRGVLRTVRILEKTQDGFFRDNERGNLRVDGPCVRDRDRRLLCQPFTVGATWTSVLSPTVIERYEITSASETVETPAGRFDRCVRVRAHNRVKASIDQVLEITYAPRVGPVRIETYVVVDGRVTPQVKAMLQSYRLSGAP